MRSSNEDVREVVKAQIIDTFNRNVKGKIPDLSSLNKSHDGREGDWLTKQMGLKVNGLNEPDFLGFEMKKDSKGKTTFGDWGPDEAVYKGQNKIIDRDSFLQVFGAPNPNKNNRFSWSGRVFPNVHAFNYAGQKISVEKKGVEVIYDPKFDTRKTKPPSIFETKLSLALWKHESLQEKVESKFNQLGWFRCLKDRAGKYERIVFGAPINYEKFLDLFIIGSIFLDCGMHQGNARPYMTWRAKNDIWQQLEEK